MKRSSFLKRSVGVLVFASASQRVSLPVPELEATEEPAFPISVVNMNVTEMTSAASPLTDLLLKLRASEKSKIDWMESELMPRMNA